MSMQIRVPTAYTDGTGELVPEWLHGNAGMGIKNGKVNWKVGAWGPQKAPSGGPGGNAPGGGQGAKPLNLELKLFNKNKT